MSAYVIITIQFILTHVRYSFEQKGISLTITLNKLLSGKKPIYEIISPKARGS